MNFLLNCGESRISPNDANEDYPIKDLFVYRAIQGITLSANYKPFEWQEDSDNVQLRLDTDLAFAVGVSILANLFPKASDHDLAQINTAIIHAQNNVVLNKENDRVQNNEGA